MENIRQTGKTDKGKERASSFAEKVFPNPKPKTESKPAIASALCFQQPRVASG
jgi:hypothetical protein